MAHDQRERSAVASPQADSCQLKTDPERTREEPRRCPNQNCRRAGATEKLVGRRPFGEKTGCIKPVGCTWTLSRSMVCKHVTPLHSRMQHPFHVRVQARVLALWKTIATRRTLQCSHCGAHQNSTKSSRPSSPTGRECCVQFVGPTRAKPESRGKHQNGRNLTRLTRNRISVRHAIVKLLSEQTLLAVVKLNATDHCIWSR